jgi:hypothetical protein
MTEAEKIPSTQDVAVVRRRLGFMVLMWWLAAGAGTVGIVQGLAAGWMRYFWVSLAWFMALFFSYAWWKVRNGQQPK